MLDQRILPGMMAGLFFSAGIGILLFHGVYEGPLAAFLRGTMGDVLVVPFFYFLWAAIRPTAWYLRALGVYAFAATLEFLQLLNLVDANSPLVLRLTLGTTFDPWDFAAYAVGLGMGVAIEGIWFRAAGARKTKTG